MNLETHLQEGERALARIWKATALRGAVAIAFAVVILIWPNVGLTALIALFGAFALVSGVATIAGAFRLPVRGGQRAWLVFEGLLGVAVGVVVFVWPDLSALGLLYAIAAWAIALGTFEIALAFVLPISGGRSLLVVLGGLLSIAFGVIMFAHPGAGAVALLALVAAFALVSGVMQIACALELRRVIAELEHRAAARDGEAGDARLKEESEMQTIDPALVTALVRDERCDAHGPRGCRKAPARVADAENEGREKAAAVMQRAEAEDAPILICYDGSNDAQRAVDAAAALLGPRHAVVLNVAPAMTVTEGMVPGGAFEDLITVDGLRRAEAGAALARRAGLDAGGRATIAPTTRQGIVDVADELDAAAIVIGSRGLVGLRRFSRGSVSHDVATHAPRPVLVVPPALTKGAV